MDELRDLMAAFPEAGKQEWIAQTLKDIKGAAFETLEYTTADGIKIEPFYTKEDIGTPGPLFSHTDWEVCERITVSDEREANRTALRYLNSGATAIILRIAKSVDFEILLEDIGITFIAIQLELYGDALAATLAFDAWLAAKNIDTSALNLTINYDPIERLLHHGDWEQREPETIAYYTRFIEANPSGRNVCVNAKLFHNAGASPAYQVGCMLAHANEYLTWLGNNHTHVKIQLNTATGPDYFIEIAKLRALRKVFALLLQQYGVEDTVYIHATSARRNLTSYDHYNNLLRTSTEAMAAVAGGCDSLQILPFSVTYKQADDFGERLARNTQLILKGESYFDKVSDVAAGSYFIENLTEALAQKGWEYFQEIEANGGMIASLKDGSIQQKIEDFAAAEQQLFDEGKQVLVGTNKFPAANQTMKDQIELPIFRERSAQTTFRPLIPTRLAANMEQARLDKETSERA